MVAFITGFIIGMVSLSVGLHYYGKYLDRKHTQHLSIISDIRMSNTHAIS
jgi:hypothetical protein